MKLIDKAMTERQQEVKDKLVENWCPASMFLEAKCLCKNEDGSYSVDKGDPKCRVCWNQEG